MPQLGSAWGPVPRGLGPRFRRQESAWATAAPLEASAKERNAHRKPSVRGRVVQNDVSDHDTVSYLSLVVVSHHETETFAG